VTTSNPNHDIATEILGWSKERPGWQRDALRRLFSAGDITPKEIDDLVQLAKAARGLTKHLAPQVLTKEHLATKGAGGEAVSLVSLTHHRGANALAAEQTVTFGPHLTIVYGQNAAGKSGYARILKQACRSRVTEKILANVLSGTAPATLRATIRFREGSAGAPVEWTVDSPPSDALAAVSVFDAACAPVYLHDKTDVAFRPFGLDIFDRLAELCGDVRGRLETEKTKLDALTPNLPTLPEGTKAKAFVDHLTSLTNHDDVRSLATLSPREQARLAELRAHQRDLLALANHIALLDQDFLVVAVARRQSITVIDFDHFAETGALAREGHQTRRNRRYFSAFGTRKIETLVHGGIAGKRIRAASEIGRNPPVLYRSTLGVDLLIEFPRQYQVLEHP